MSHHDFLLTIIFLGIGTFLIRASIIFLSTRFKFNDRIKEILSFIPAAVLPCLLAPMAYFHQGTVEILLGKERMIALLLSTIVCYLTRNMLATLTFGLGTLYLFTQGLA